MITSERMQMENRTQRGTVTEAVTKNRTNHCHRHDSVRSFYDGFGDDCSFRKEYVLRASHQLQSRHGKQDV